MNHKVLFTALLIALAVGLSVMIVDAQGPQPRGATAALGTGFTYQGQLKKNNTPVNDNNCSMTFSLWDSQSNGTGQVGSSQIINPVAVANGLFTVVLNSAGQFGASAFTGQERWLQAAVLCAGDGSPVTLSRQPLTAAPYALFSAAPWVTSGGDLYYNGKVGIGNNNPLGKLEVTTANDTAPGTIFAWDARHFVVGSTGNSGGIGMSYDQANSVGYIEALSPNVLWRNLVLQSGGGNVGIGTNSPGVQLHVAHNTSYGNGSSYAIAASNPTTPTLRLNLGYDPALDAGVIQASQEGVTWDKNLLLNPNGGNVGLGTTNPFAVRLLVRGPDTSTFGEAFRVVNSAGSRGLSVWDDGTVSIGALYGSSPTYAHACLSPGFYFAGCSSAAEYVPTIDNGIGFPETAELVSLAPAVKNPYDDEHAPFVVTKSNKPCDDNLLGFIVNPESGADGKKLNEHYLPLAIYGYFPAKVTMENGAIRRGDALTSSSKPGYGMKATQACKIIGYALGDADHEGTIQVFANHGENAASEVAKLRTQVQEMKQTAASLKQEKDVQIAAQQKQINSLQARLTALEQQANNANPSSNPQQVMLGLGTLLMLGVVYHQHRTNRGGQ